MVVSSVVIINTTLFVLFKFDLTDTSDCDFIVYFRPIFIIIGCLTLLGIFFTLIFLYMDKLCCCCCSCFLSAPGQLSVFDPDHPEKTLVIKGEEVIDGDLELEDKTDKGNRVENKVTGVANSMKIILY